MTTLEQLRQGLDLLVDAAVTHDLHPSEIKEELQRKITEMDDMMKESGNG